MSNALWYCNILNFQKLWCCVTGWTLFSPISSSVEALPQKVEKINLVMNFHKNY